MEKGINDLFLRTDHLKSNLRKRVTQGGAISILFQAIQFALNLVSVAVLGRLLTPNDYGLVGMVAAVTGFVSLLSEGGLSTATIQKEDISQDQVSTLFWVNVALGGLMTVLVVALSPLVARFYSDPKLLPLTIAMGGVFALNGLGVQHRAILVRQMRYLHLGVISTVAQVFSLIIAAFAGLNGLGYWSLVVLLYASSALTVAGYWIVCGWRPNLPRRNVGAKTLISFGTFISLNSAIYNIVKNLESVLIGRTAGAEQLGYYTRAGALVQNPMQQLMGPLGGVAIPALSRVSQEPERFKKAFVLLCEVVTVVIVPMVTFMVVTSDWIIDLLLGPKWLHLAPIAAVMALGAFAAPIAAVGTWALTAQQKGRQLFLWSIVNSILLGIAIVAGLRWGALGVATVVAITGIFIRTPILFYTVGKYTPAKQMDIYGAILPPILCALGVTGLLWVFRQYVTVANPAIGLVAALIIAATAYGLALFFSPRGRKVLSLIDQLKGNLAVKSGN